MKLVDLAGVLLEGVTLEKVATPMELTLTLVVGDEKLELEWRVDELLLETSTGTVSKSIHERQCNSLSVLIEAEVVNRSDSRLKSSTDSVLPLEAESFPVSTPEFPLALLPP